MIDGKEIIDGMIYGRVKPHIYAFETNSVPNFLKVGRTLVESMHMRWAPNADAALKDAVDIVGENATVTVIPDGVGVIL